MWEIIANGGKKKDAIESQQQFCQLESFTIEKL